MKKTFSILLMAASVAMAAPQAYYTVDNSNGLAAESHNLGNIGSNGISVAVKIDAQKFLGIGRVTTQLFSVGNANDSLTAVSEFDDYYPGINTGFSAAFGGVNYDQPCAQLFTDKGNLQDAAYVTLMFAYRKDGATGKKQTGTDAEGNPIYETVVISDSAVFYLSVWDSEGNIINDIQCGIDGFTELPLYGIESFTLFNINSDYITYAEVYDTEVTDAEGAEIFNRMINGEDESDSSGDADTTVPEPATATLSLLALAALAARRRRK